MLQSTNARPSVRRSPAARTVSLLAIAALGVLPASGASAATAKPATCAALPGTTLTTRTLDAAHGHVRVRVVQRLVRRKSDGKGRTVPEVHACWQRGQRVRSEPVLQDWDGEVTRLRVAISADGGLVLRWAKRGTDDVVWGATDARATWTAQFEDGGTEGPGAPLLVTDDGAIVTTWTDGHLEAIDADGRRTLSTGQVGEVAIRGDRVYWMAGGVPQTALLKGRADYDDDYQGEAGLVPSP